MEVRMDIQATLDEREKTHGSFENVAECAIRLRRVVSLCLRDFHDDHHISYVQEEALHMICSKIGRILAGNPNCKEHWHDIAGYATLAEQVCVEETKHVQP
jgi:hypothetical protein